MPLLPPQPLAFLPLPSGPAGQPLQAEVPVIPEGDPRALLVLGLLGWAAWTRLRHR
jgi:hypothetical protein